MPKTCSTTPKNLVGRPSKLTPKRVKRLCKFLVEDVRIKQACEYAQIKPWTFNHWMNLAKQEIATKQAGRFSHFFLRVRRAQYAALIDRMAHKPPPKSGGWRASVWWLETMCPAEYGPPRVQRKLKQLSRDIDAAEKLLNEQKKQQQKSQHA